MDAETRPATRDLVLMPIKVLTVLYILISLIALLRTSKLPKAAKYLNAGLLSFDFLTTGCYIAITFLDEKTFAFAIVSKAVTGFTVLAHLTVTMMSIDRLIAVLWPHKFLRITRSGRYLKFIIAVWITVFISFHMVSSVLCFHIRIPKDFGDICSAVCLVIYGILFILITLVPCCSYVTIFRIIRSQLLRTSTRTFLRQNRSTSIVLFYIINVLFTTILYTSILVFINDLEQAMFYGGIIYLVNGLFNTCAYVLWFPECRLELLIMLSKCFPGLRRKVLLMRVELFNLWIMKKHREKLTMEDKTLEKTSKTETPISGNNRNKENQTTENISDGYQSAAVNKGTPENSQHRAELTLENINVREQPTEGKPEKSERAISRNIQNLLTSMMAAETANKLPTEGTILLGCNDQDMETVKYIVCNELSTDGQKQNKEAAENVTDKEQPKAGDKQATEEQAIQENIVEQ